MRSTDHFLLAALKNNERTAFIKIYDHHFPVLANYIIRNGGTREDAEDLFQESMMVLLYNLRKPNFILSSSLRTYLFAINRNLWLKKHRDKIPMTGLEIKEEWLVQEDFSVLEEYKAQEKNKKNWLQDVIEKISRHCVILITEIFFKNQQSEALIRALGYRNAHSFNTQKYKCLSQLRKEGKKIPQTG